MTMPVSTIPNIGPATEAAFARAGITSAESLRAMGADAAYLRWLNAGLAPHFIGYYALVMGLQGRPWNDCRGAEKQALRARFDALKAAAESARHPGDLPAGIEKAFDEIGLVPRRPAGAPGKKTAAPGGGRG
ncbi:TfoX/Sxy family DNA transformation protein [Albidovulum sp.]|uniref:TfoX/Sxy family DNA transformation protein n=1 Tax=Albidovulum sp. TaxID=1872424 RepID=UPI0039B8733F